jgi:hypothetical protein
MTRAELYARRRELIAEIQKIADSYDKMAKDTQKLIDRLALPTDRPLTRVEARMTY